MQTFKYAPISETPAKLKVAVDITASYILLSDMHRKVYLFVSNFYLLRELIFLTYGYIFPCLVIAYFAIEEKRRRNRRANLRYIAVSITISDFKLWYC